MEDLQTAAPAPPAAPPQAAGTTTVRRSVALAIILSFLPGLGHLYLGLYRRGIVFFTAFAFSLLLADSRHDALGVVIAFVWFFAVIDSFRCAQAVNLGQTAVGAPGELAGPRAPRYGNLGFGIFIVLAGAVLLYNQFYPIDLYFVEEWWPLAIVLFGAYVVAKHLWVERRRRLATENGAA